MFHHRGTKSTEKNDILKLGDLCDFVVKNASDKIKKNDNL